MGKKKFNYGQITTEPFYGAVAVAANGLRLGVCYFALQMLQALDKIYRQNNSTKPLLVAGAAIETKW